MKTLTTVIAACAIPVIGVAMAQQPQPSGAAQQQTPEDETAQGIPATQHQEDVLELPSDHFRQLDTNADGVISQSEARADSTLSDGWADFDADGNDELSAEEFLTFEQRAETEDEQTDVAIARGEATEDGIPATEHQEEVLRSDIGDDDEAGERQTSRDETQRDDAAASERRQDEN